MACLKPIADFPVPSNVPQLGPEMGSRCEGTGLSTLGSLGCQLRDPTEATMIVGYEFGHRWSEKQRQEVNFARTEQFAKQPGPKGVWVDGFLGRLYGQ